MMSPAYATCVQRLERVLSPRVVSRVLRAALQSAGQDPSDVTAEQLEPILKDAIFKQLQVTMSVDQARSTVQETMTAMKKAEGGGEDEGAEQGDADGSTAPAEAAATDAATQQAAPKTEVEHPEVERLRSELRPLNLYFAWPEVRRLRAQVERLQEAAASGEATDEAVAEADATLQAVRQKLEDQLVLQAQELASLEEAIEDVRGLGGIKVRRLEALIKRIGDAQQNRQLAEAELERGRTLVRDLRKMQASSVFESISPSEGAKLREQIAALDLAAEVERVDRLEREWHLLLQHRPDLSERLQQARAKAQAGEALGDEPDSIETAFASAQRERLEQIDAELNDTAARLDAAGAWTPQLRSELEVLRSLLADGLPPQADLVRFTDRTRLALQSAERDEVGSASSAPAVAPLDAQAARLARAQEDLLRFEGDDDPALDRYRDAVEALRDAQADERLDPQAEAELRNAASAWAEALQQRGDASEAHRTQREALRQRLDGLPARLDPEGTAALHQELDAVAEGDDQQLAAVAAAVSDAVRRAQAEAQRKLERLADIAAAWNDHERLGEVRSANERLEEGVDPDLESLERSVHESAEQAAAQQLARLHELEAEAERLVGVDPERERTLEATLAKVRPDVQEGRPAAALAEAEQHLGDLKDALGLRLHDFLPRLDQALQVFRKVERLNSDDVATVRRILGHLDGQRDALERVSPGLRARMEASLQEAEDLLGRLEEEERATRAIADQLMSDDRFDGLLDLFGSGEERAAAGPDGPSADGDATEAWLRERSAAARVVTAGLLDPHAAKAAQQGSAEVPADAWQPPASDLLRRTTELGDATGLGTPQLVTLEADGGCVLLGVSEEGAALLASNDPASVGILAADLRSRDAWLPALRALASAKAEDDASSDTA